jgi:hypothetical protein
MSSLMSARERAQERIQQGTAAPSRTVSELRKNIAEGTPNTPAEADQPKPVSIGDKQTSFAALRQRQQIERGEQPTTAVPEPKPKPETPPPAKPKPSDSYGDNTGSNIGSRLLKRRRSDDDSEK